MPLKKMRIKRYQALLAGLLLTVFTTKVVAMEDQMGSIHPADVVEALHYVVFSKDSVSIEVLSDGRFQSASSPGNKEYEHVGFAVAGIRMTAQSEMLAVVEDVSRNLRAFIDFEALPLPEKMIELEEEVEGDVSTTTRKMIMDNLAERIVIQTMSGEFDSGDVIEREARVPVFREPGTNDFYLHVLNRWIPLD